MRDKEYKGKCIRMSDETWVLLKLKRIRSGKSWNLFLLSLLKKNYDIKK